MTTFGDTQGSDTTSTGGPAPLHQPDAGTPPLPAEPAPAPSPAKSTAAKIGRTVAVIALVVLGRVGYQYYQNTHPDLPPIAVGDCVNETPKAEDTKAVSCTSSDAAYKVLKVNHNVPQANGVSSFACQDVDAADYVLWLGSVGVGSTGDQLCVQTLAKK